MDELLREIRDWYVLTYGGPPPSIGAFVDFAGDWLATRIEADAGELDWLFQD